VRGVVLVMDADRLREILRSMNEDGGRERVRGEKKDEKTLRKEQDMSISARRVHKMEKVSLDRRATRPECQAALLSAHAEFPAHWPADKWDQKDEHLAFLDAAVSASNAIAQANTAVDVVAALDNALILERPLDLTRVRSCIHDLLMRIAKDVLLELARKQVQAAKNQ